MIGTRGARSLGALYNSGLDENDLIIQPRKEPEVGSIIAYRLPLSERPINPNKVWRGKVVSLNRAGVMVEMLEPGYARLQEFVLSANIVGVE